jgi:hypothetical protein
MSICDDSNVAVSSSEYGAAPTHATTKLIRRWRNGICESMSRVRLMEEGLPRPEPQYEIFGPDGRLVARVDFYWDDHKTVGEFDGKINTVGFSSAGSVSRT